MESKAKRTLVKSAPELWELADDAERMQEWMAGLVGSDQPVQVEVTDEKKESKLGWSATDSGASITISLTESSFGTSVSIVAEHERSDPAEAIAALEQLLDELAEPEHRPFSRD